MDDSRTAWLPTCPSCRRLIQPGDTPRRLTRKRVDGVPTDDYVYTCTPAPRGAIDTTPILTVYVPADAVMQGLIAPRSAIVGKPHPGVSAVADSESHTVQIDYEGGLYARLTYWEKLRAAAGRSMVGYPTVARMVVPESWLVPVGTFNTATDGFRITNEDALSAWIGTPIQTILVVE